MAVIKKGENEITITNGDWAALKRIAASYGLSDESDVIVFALGVLDRANGKAVTVEQADGSTIRLIPSEKLRRKTEPTSDGEQN